MLDEIRRTTVGTAALELVVGNIVRESTDAIVNPAQRDLSPGAGVDGDIHLWGGSQIEEECRALDGCDTGDAKITSGGDLTAKYVIHTVGPIWTGGEAGEADALASCYRRCLEVAEEHGLRSISFPAISTGHYGYPLREAATIALATVIIYLKAHPGCVQVRFILKGRNAFEAFGDVLDRMLLSG